MITHLKVLSLNLRWPPMMLLVLLPFSCYDMKYPSLGKSLMRGSLRAGAIAAGVLLALAGNEAGDGVLLTDRELAVHLEQNRGSHSLVGMSGSSRRDC
jgi:hypothetical protein